MRSNNTSIMARRAMAARALDFVLPRCSPLLKTPHSSFGATTFPPRAFSAIASNSSPHEHGRLYDGSSSLGASSTSQKITTTTRQFNFASSQYASCFDEIPTPDVVKLRKDAVKYLDSFDKQSWYDDPVRSSSGNALLHVVLFE